MTARMSRTVAIGIHLGARISCALLCVFFIVIWLDMVAFCVARIARHDSGGTTLGDTFFSVLGMVWLGLCGFTLVRLIGSIRRRDNRDVTSVSLVFAAALFWFWRPSGVFVASSMPPLLPFPVSVIPIAIPLVAPFVVFFLMRRVLLGAAKHLGITGSAGRKGHDTEPDLM